MQSERTLREVQHLPNFPRLILSVLTEDGYNEGELLEGIDISPSQLADETFRLSAHQHEQFILRVLAITNDLHLALRISQKVDIATSSLAIMAVINSGRISRALSLFSRYGRLFTRTLDTRTIAKDAGLAIALEPTVRNEHVQYFAITAYALFLDRVFLAPLNGAHLVRRLELALPPPPDFGAVRDQFGFAVMFGALQNRVILDPAFIDQPLKQADPQTVRLLEEMCEAQLAAAHAESDLSHRVSAIFLNNISAPPKLAELASTMGMSPRSLRRRLKDDGTSYQKILDVTRQELAQSLLKETAEAVASIAYELGFDNPSHFGRAFKGWTGQSPSEYRKRASDLA
jgi:AraC-like DNA-binding protein